MALNMADRNHDSGLPVPRGPGIVWPVGLAPMGTWRNVRFAQCRAMSAPSITLVREATENDDDMNEQQHLFRRLRVLG